MATARPVKQGDSDAAKNGSLGTATSRPPTDGHDTLLKIRFQADTDLNEDIVAGVLRRQPEVDFGTALGGRPSRPGRQIGADVGSKGRTDSGYA